ncbi:type II secretion system F family protein [Candidatus Micrarchaeota archaeon]|nr:type II secretion system F family protein [Candidatus Micrarchaeota archaeon]
MPVRRRLYEGAKPAKQFVEKPRMDWFVRFVKFANKYFASYGKGAKLTTQQRELFEFLNYKITGEEFRAAEIAAMMLGLAATIVVVLILAIVFGGLSSPFFLIGALLAFLIPLFTFMLVAYRPQMEAKREQTLALGYMPEIVNYLVSSMRLTPNLEKAVDFTASHGRGKIAEDMKKIVWDVQIGKYPSVEEALDELAYKWGRYNEDFKQALMIVRSSVLEANDAKREALLEKAAADVLEGTKEKMDGFARALSQPTVYLYYFGVLLPLMLAIVLPIGGTLAGGSFPLARPEILALIYLVGLPIGLIVLGFAILGSRPPTYEPPEIDENYPGLPPNGSFSLGGINFPVVPLALALLVAAIAVGYTFDQGIAAGISQFERAEALAAMPHVELPGIPPTQLFLGMFTLLSIIIGLGLAGGAYLFGTYSARKKAQDEIRAMEREFKDAIYVLASRLGENRPLEDALKHAVEFLPNSKVASRVFRKILDNITTMGMTIDDAVFHPDYGALKNIPSRTLESGLRITIDSIGLGVNVAAKSLIGLALQLRNSEKIDQLLRNLLAGVTSMLKTMGTFIAPIVLGVVTSLQGVIVNALSANCADVPAQTGPPGAAGFGGGNLSSLFCKPSGEEAASTDPALFTFIMGLYVIEVVIILTYFNSQIEDSNNKLYTYLEIAKALPIATIIFALVAYFAGTSIGA